VPLDIALTLPYLVPALCDRCASDWTFDPATGQFASSPEAAAAHARGKIVAVSQVSCPGCVIVATRMLASFPPPSASCVSPLAGCAGHARSWRIRWRRSEHGLGARPDRRGHV